MNRKVSPLEEQQDVADLIDRFVGGAIGKYEWDDFTSLRGRSPGMEALRVEIVAICDKYPATASNQWCSAEGLQQLQAVGRRLRDGAAA